MSSSSTPVADEIQQRRPFQSTAQEAVVALLRTCDAAVRHLAGVLEPHDITLQQYNVLRILRGAERPLPTMEISDRMIEQAPGVTRMLDRMENKGLVRRERPSGDRRQVLCSITPKGLDLVNALDEPMNAADEQCFAALDAQEQGKLIAMLDAIRAGLRT